MGYLVHSPEIGPARNLAMTAQCIFSRASHFERESHSLDSRCDGTIDLFKLNDVRYVDKSSWSNFSVHNLNVEQ